MHEDVRLGEVGERPAVLVVDVLEAERAAHHPFGRDPVDLARHRSHEVAASARRDEAREPVGLQVPELLAPERAVVVEDGDPLLGRHGLRGALGERDDRLRRLGVVPGAQFRHSVAGGDGGLEPLLHLVDREAFSLHPRRIVEKGAEKSATNAFAGDTLCPVMNADRPAVQLCSPYASVNRIPSLANGRC